jgi:ABC-type dipeptide/oligopeptide/nickel transport system permease component
MPGAGRRACRPPRAGWGSSMARFIVVRFAQSLLAILAVVFAVSVIIRLIPGDPVDIMMSGNPGMTKADREKFREELGLTRPVLVQFGVYLYDGLHGDFGESFRFRQPTLQLLGERLPATVELTLFSMLVAALISVPFGILTALKRDSALDFLGSVIALLGVSIPSFLLGILLVLLFSVTLHWLPTGGRGEPLSTAVADLVVKRSARPLLDSLEHLLLPSIALGAAVAAWNTRLIRSAMLEVLRQDYIRFARAKGLSARVVVLKHAFRNALIPTITIWGLQIGYLLGGAFVIENVFAWPGIGRLAVQSVFNRDYPLIQTIALFTSVIFVLASFLVDVLYHWVDPRIRYG